MTTNISVNHEWGTLKEAVVGTPISMRIPNWSDEYEVVTKEVQQFIKEKQGQLLKDANRSL